MPSCERRPGVSPCSLSGIDEVPSFLVPIDPHTCPEAHATLFSTLLGPESRSDLIALVRSTNPRALLSFRHPRRRNRTQTEAARQFLAAVVAVLGDAVVDPRQAKRVTREIVHQFTRDQERPAVATTVRWVNCTYHFFVHAHFPGLQATAPQEISMILILAGLHAERVRERQRRLAIPVRYGPDVQQSEHVVRDAAHWSPGDHPTCLAEHRHRARHQREIVTTRPTRGPNSIWMTTPPHPDESATAA